MKEKQTYEEKLAYYRIKNKEYRDKNRATINNNRNIGYYCIEIKGKKYIFKKDKIIKISNRNFKDNKHEFIVI